MRDFLCVCLLLLAGAIGSAPAIAADPLPQALDFAELKFKRTGLGAKPDGQVFVEYQPDPGIGLASMTLAFSHYPGSDPSIPAAMRALVDALQRVPDRSKLSIVEHPSTGEAIVHWTVAAGNDGHATMTLVRYALSASGREVMSALVEWRWPSGVQDAAAVGRGRAKLLDALANLDMGPARRHFASADGAR